MRRKSEFVLTAVKIVDNALQGSGKYRKDLIEELHNSLEISYNSATHYLNGVYSLCLQAIEKTNKQRGGREEVFYEKVSNTDLNAIASYRLNNKSNID